MVIGMKINMDVKINRFVKSNLRFDLDDIYKYIYTYEYIFIHIHIYTYTHKYVYIHIYTVHILAIKRRIEKSTLAHNFEGIKRSDYSFSVKYSTL
jgi:hypothetical protein